MFKRHSIGLTLATAAMVVLAGCGSKDTGPSFSSTISNADAADAGSQADVFSGDLVNTFDFGTGPSGLALSAKASPRAVALLNKAWIAAGGRAPRYSIKGMGAPPLEMSPSFGCDAYFGGQAGDTTDSDGDGIPNNDVINISCDTSEGAAHLSIHGSVSLADIAGLYGYRFDVNLTLVESVADTSVTEVISGHDYATFTSGSATDDLDLSITDILKQGSLSEGGVLHENWNATFTPTTDALVLGDPLPDGHISFTGGFYITNVADAAQNFRFDILTTVPLAFSAACYASNDQPPFTDGQIQGKFNGNASVGFTVTYDNGCDNDPTIVGTGNATS
jgi:hypothetical protein